MAVNRLQVLRTLVGSATSLRSSPSSPRFPQTTSLSQESRLLVGPVHGPKRGTLLLNDHTLSLRRYHSVVPRRSLPLVLSLTENLGKQAFLDLYLPQQALRGQGQGMTEIAGDSPLVRTLGLRRRRAIEEGGTAVKPSGCQLASIGVVMRRRASPNGTSMDEDTQHLGL